MLRVTDCKLLSWDLKQGIQLQSLGSCSLAPSTFVLIPPFFWMPPSSKHILLSLVYCPPLRPCYTESFWFLNFCFLFLEDPFLTCTCQRSSRPSSNALDRISYLESLSFLYLWFLPFFRGCFMFSREMDVLPDPLSNLASAGCPYRPTSVDAINQTFLSLYFFFFFGSANERHQIESRGQEKTEVRMFIPLMLWKGHSWGCGLTMKKSKMLFKTFLCFSGSSE